MKYNPFHMADYNIKSQNTVLPYYNFVKQILILWH